MGPQAPYSFKASRLGSSMSYVKVGHLDDFVDGKGSEVLIGARRIAVFRDGQEIRAIKNICPHEGELLHRCSPRDGAAVCVGHGWRFDLKTGNCTKGPSESRVAVYPARINEGEVEIDLG